MTSLQPDALTDEPVAPAITARVSPSKSPPQGKKRRASARNRGEEGASSPKSPKRSPKEGPEIAPIRKPHLICPENPEHTLLTLTISYDTQIRICEECETSHGEICFREGVYKFPALGKGKPLPKCTSCPLKLMPYDHAYCAACERPVCDDGPCSTGCERCADEGLDDNFYCKRCIKAHKKTHQD